MVASFKSVSFLFMQQEALLGLCPEGPCFVAPWARGGLQGPRITSDCSLLLQAPRDCSPAEHPEEGSSCVWSQPDPGAPAAPSTHTILPKGRLQGTAKVTVGTEEQPQGHRAPGHTSICREMSCPGQLPPLSIPPLTSMAIPGWLCAGRAGQSGQQTQMDDAECS